MSKNKDIAWDIYERWYDLGSNKLIESITDALDTKDTEHNAKTELLLLAIESANDRIADLESELYSDKGNPINTYEWEYISGEGMYGMKDSIRKKGKGTLVLSIKPGNSLMIIGDEGITTSQIKEVIDLVEGYKLVVTNNSTYKVRRQ